MRENILMLTVVLPDGEVITTGTRARKSSAGYDLTHLFIGAEGTLGIMTEITLRIQGVPEAISAAVVGFGSFEAAIQAVTQVRQIGVPIARIEFLDEITVKAVNQFSGLTLVEQPTLFLEFHGSNASVKDNVEQVGEVMGEFGGSDFKWAVNQAERTTLWTARHNAYYASLAYRPGCRALTTDVCVPISRLAECIAETKRDLAESFLVAPMVGHVGDGNFHMLLLVDPNNAWLFNEKFKVDVALNSADVLAHLIQEEMSLGDMMTIFKIRRGRYSVVEEKVPAGAKGIGIQLKDMGLAEYCVIAAIIRDGVMTLPRGDSTLQEEDEIIAVASTEGAQKLAELLAHPVYPARKGKKESE